MARPAVVTLYGSFAQSPCVCCGEPAYRICIVCEIGTHRNPVCFAAFNQHCCPEWRFRLAVRRVHARGHVPTPSRIFAVMGRKIPRTRGGGTSLNGRQCVWRREELLRLGYVREQRGLYNEEGTLRWVYSPAAGPGTVTILDDLSAPSDPAAVKAAWEKYSKHLPGGAA